MEEDGGVDSSSIVVFPPSVMGKSTLLEKHNTGAQKHRTCQQGTWCSWNSNGEEKKGGQGAGGLERENQ